MAGHPSHPRPLGFPSVVAENHILTATKEKTLAENSKEKNREKKFLPEPIPESKNEALRFERPPAPLVVRKARKALG